MASELGVQTIQHTNGTDAMTIDSSGRILTPARPAFMVKWSATQSGITSANDFFRLNFDEEVFDTGNNVSSAAFTTPVAGVYHFDLKQRFDNVGSGFLVLALSNHASTAETTSDLYNSSYVINGSPDTSYITLQTSITIELPASYVVAPYYFNSADTNYNLVVSGASFSGFLVG